jgi:hypothetical protein
MQMALHLHSLPTVFFAVIFTLLLPLSVPLLELPGAFAFVAYYSQDASFTVAAPAGSLDAPFSVAYTPSTFGPALLPLPGSHDPNFINVTLVTPAEPDAKQCADVYPGGDYRNSFLLHMSNGNRSALGGCTAAAVTSPAHISLHIVQVLAVLSTSFCRALSLLVSPA